MTTTADNMRRWLERVPAIAEVLELHPLGALPTDSPLACWPRDDVTRDPELVRTAIADTAQEHCDDEAVATSYILEWKKGERVIGSRRARFQPSPGSAPPASTSAAPIDANAIIQTLLKTVTDQQRLMIQAVGAVTAAHQSTLTSVTEQVRELVGRVLIAEASGGGASTTIDPEERALRLKALGVVVNEGPSILKLIVHGVATKMLGPDAAEAIDDMADAVEGATKQ